MGYDEQLASRMRELLAGEDGITERRMFGGLAFQLHGHIAVGAAGRGGMIVRIDPAASDELLERPHVTPLSIGGRRPMEGWIVVAADGLRTDAALGTWVRRGVDFAKQLPAK